MFAECWPHQVQRSPTSVEIQRVKSLLTRLGLETLHSGGDGGGGQHSCATTTSQATLTPASNIHASVSPVAPLSIQFPADVQEKAGGHSPEYLGPCHPHGSSRKLLAST